MARRRQNLGIRAIFTLVSIARSFARAPRESRNRGSLERHLIRRCLMWKPEHRATADRRGLRYESDLTEAEWALVAPLIRPAKRGGRPRTVNVREILNAIFYVLWTGCQWKALPKDLPPRSTVWEYVDLWDWDGTLERIHHALYVEMRENAGREASPTTAIIDSQTAKGAVKGGLRSTRPAMTLARRCLAASATF